MRDLWRAKITVWWQRRSRTEQRCLIGYAIVLAALLLWPIDDAPALTDYNATSVAPDRAQPTKQKHWEIRGLADTTGKIELRDPFAPHHPTRAEAQKNTETPENLTDNKTSPDAPTSGKLSPGLAAGTAADNTAAAVPADAPVYKLNGIAVGENTSLALVTNGRETVTVAAGDICFGKTVLAVGADYIVWQDDTGREELRLNTSEGGVTDERNAKNNTSGGYAVLDGNFFFTSICSGRRLSDD